MRRRAGAAARARSEDVVAAELFAEYYRDDLTLYSVENSGTCCRLLVRRCRA